MKIFKAALVLYLMFTFLPSHAQGVEKSLFNVQTGLVGVWVNHEGRLGEKFALRTELGLEGVGAIRENQKDTYGLAPSINIEPRWYYNIIKRNEKGKNTTRNSANFLTVSFKFLPDLLIIGGGDNDYVPNQIAIVPKWGMRRAIANSNFNYELGGGIGYFHTFLKEGQYVENNPDVAVDIHVRIGYTF
jgi:hypothetical protein